MMHARHRSKFSASFVQRSILSGSGERRLTRSHQKSHLYQMSKDGTTQPFVKGQKLYGLCFSEVKPGHFQELSLGSSNGTSELCAWRGSDNGDRGRWVVHDSLRQAAHDSFRNSVRAISTLARSACLMAGQSFSLRTSVFHE